MSIKQQIEALPNVLSWVPEMMHESWSGSRVIHAINLKALAASHERLKLGVAKAIYDLRAEVSKEERHRIVSELLAVLDPAEDLTGQVPSHLKETR